MFRQRIHIAAVLLCAWNVYSQCQHETILPLIAGCVLLVSFLLGSRSLDTQFKLFEKMPLFAVIIISLFLGYFFRSAYSLPAEAVTPYPELTAAAQSATIIAALFLWLKPSSSSNLYLMTLMAWLTVALSIDVPFTYPLFFKFSVFCLVSVIVVILHTSHRPQNKKYIFKYYRDFIFFSVVLVAATVVLFFGVSRSVTVLDNAFMNAMENYVLSRNYTNFLNISSKLSLISPGDSAFDRRPVLEVTVPNPKIKSVYLKTQAFKDFNNGTWEEVKDPPLTPVPKQLVKQDTKINLTMFVPFKNIIPSPSGVTAIEGPGDYKKDENQIIYGQEERQTRVLNFSAREINFPVGLTQPAIEEYKRIPADIAPELTKISSGVVGTETDTENKVQLIRDFFKNGFEYSLDVDFRADNKGLIAMIEEKRPAYCTYFATAMSLLLRAQGVPSRVVTGFIVYEVVDKASNTFLARVRNAHAWVEVLLPQVDPQTGQTTNAWLTFDPTPSAVAESGSEGNTGFDLERFTEKFWLGVLRFTAYMQNIDKDKLKQYLIFLLLLTMFLMNTKAIIRGLKSLVAKKKKKIKTIPPPAGLQLVYKRYEQYLQKTFQETRRPTETDHEVVERLKQRPEVPKGSIAKVELFVKHYHAARFGEKKDESLEEMLR